ncbi:hypothetical protein [Anatilimnocola floriformis]|uniref:hypothetical protein n=1 Tax=Anatilimnocola floriformis TaxID=2948575 RepID=UPI0020C5971D|nr:hypothetical protein [Anatilimnocola floriformis]
MTRILTAAFILTLISASAAFALPPIPDHVLEHYGPDAKITATLKAQMGKCGMCHIPGADKKAKGHGLNDFGKAVHDNFKHKDYMAEVEKSKKEGAADADKAAAKAKALQILGDALTKASELKNADGKVFGDLIKAGTMPGTNPPPKPEEKK